jgi:hypothetical protein
MSRSSLRPASAASALVALVAAGATTAAVALPAAASTATRVRVVSDCVKPHYRPSSIIVTCGDAGIILAKLHWSSWGTTSARATGRAEVKTCDPNCAAGGVKGYRVSVRLSKPEACGAGDRRFTAISYTFTAGRPKGLHSTERMRFRCPAH